MHTKFWLESFEGIDLREVGLEGMYWIHPAQDNN
jgi:hypothetical protein